MPVIRQHGGSSSVTSHGTSHSQPNGTGAKNVWFYMTGAKTSTRPSDEDLQRYFEEDNHRQRTGLTYQRPKEVKIRCVVCLLEKDKWQTWHNRAGPIAKILRQHLDGRHAIICTDDVVDSNTEPQQAKPPSLTEDHPKSAPSSTKSTATESSKPSAEAPRSCQTTSQPSSSNISTPTPHSPASPERSPHAESSKPRPRAPKSVEKLRAELEKVKAECEQAKAERDKEAHERRLLKEELRRLKESERARDQELLKLSNSFSSSLQALVKKQGKSSA